MANSFNIVDFKNGKIAINGLGQEVKFITETRGQMMVNVKEKFKSYTMKMNTDGKKYTGTDTVYDLVSMKDAA